MAKREKKKKEKKENSCPLKDKLRSKIIFCAFFFFLFWGKPSEGVAIYFFLLNMGMNLYRDMEYYSLPTKQTGNEENEKAFLNHILLQSIVHYTVGEEMMEPHATEGETTDPNICASLSLSEKTKSKEKVGAYML